MITHCSLRPGGVALVQSALDHDLRGLWRVETLGIWQMHHNVYEWVVDVYQLDHSETPTKGSPLLSDPLPEDPTRVLRGGSWYSERQGLRSANRFSFVPDYVLSFIGFRSARTLVTHQGIWFVFPLSESSIAVLVAESRRSAGSARKSI